MQKEFFSRPEPTKSQMGKEGEEKEEGVNLKINFLIHNLGIGL